MENKSKIIIVALIIVIAALLVGIFASMPNLNKQNTNLTFKCNSTINEGDSIRIQLTDANGTAIANQTVNITVMDKDKSTDHHSVVTNGKGVGTLNIDKKAGNYIITVKYDGNDKYAGCNASKKIKIEEKVVEATQQSSAQSSNSHLVIGEDGYYFMVDDNGNILENLGPSKKYYPNNPNSVYYPNAESSGKYIDKSK